MCGWRAKTGAELDALRDCGRINAEVHRAVRAALTPGITGNELDAIARHELRALGAAPSFPEWAGFPYAVCVSLNEVVGHGLPSAQEVCDGDIVKIDLGVYYAGVHTDAARTYVVGTGSDLAHRLRVTAEAALRCGIDAVRPGQRISNISHAIWCAVSGAGFDVVRHAFGHGIGVTMHEDPGIANFGPPGLGPRLRAGMVLAIEPVITMGLRFTRVLPDGWTTVTVDGLPAAHVEDTILVTEQGPVVLTATDDASTDASAVAGGPVSLGVPDGYRLRSASPSDHEAMLRLAHETMDDVLIAAWGRRAQRRELLDVQGAEMLVLEHQGDLVGYMIYVVNDAVFLNTLVLAPDHQGKGLGRHLMGVLEAIARQRGRTAVELWVQTTNPKALRFYERLGFRRTGCPFYNTVSMRKDFRDAGHA